MSSKRMFSEEITSSDAFVDMPSESQLLYFHLGMRADDDGFVSGTKIVQKIIGAGDDALMLLFAKKFLIKFDRGICVIKHWRMNNLIRKDIYKPTKYISEKSMLFIKENGVYTLNEEGSVPVPNGHFTVDELFRNNITSTLRRRNVDLGKVRLGKVREDKIDTDTPQIITKNFFKGIQDLKQSSVSHTQVTSAEGIDTQKFLKEIQVRYPEAPKEIIWDEIQKFERYWTEKNSTGKKERWQMNKTFEVSRRLTTWFGKLSSFKKEQKINSNNKYKAGRIIINTK